MYVPQGKTAVIFNFVVDWNKIKNGQKRSQHKLRYVLYLTMNFSKVFFEIFSIVLKIFVSCKKLTLSLFDIETSFVTRLPLGLEVIILALYITDTRRRGVAVGYVCRHNSPIRDKSLKTLSRDVAAPR